MLAITSDRFTSNMTHRFPTLLEVMVFKIFVHHQLLNISESTNRGASWYEQFPVYYYKMPLLDGLATQILLRCNMKHFRRRRTTTVCSSYLFIFAPCIISLQKHFFIAPTDAHYHKIIEMLKQFKNYNTCSDMFRFK
jgi:hypothetical protein